MTLDEISDLKSHLNRRIETEKELMLATYRNNDAINALHDFLWKQEMAEKKRLQNQAQIDKVGPA